MRVPQLNSTNKNTIFTQQFLGYNHNLRTSEGEFYDMSNMSTDHFPVISTRQGEQELTALLGNPNGLWQYAPDTLMAVAGNQLRIGITKDSIGEIVAESSQYLADSEKSFATIGAYTVIMPDKVIFNSVTNQLSRIVQSFSNTSYDGQYLILQMIPCDIEGVSITYEANATAPVDKTVYWYDTVNNIYKKYSTSMEQWIQVESPYMKLIPRISAEENAYVAPEDTLSDNAIKAKQELSEFFGSLSPLDTVSYSGDKDATSDSQFFDYVVYGTGTEEDTSYIIISMVGVESVTSFTIRTKCPDLDHLIALNNRVWGVSNSTHEIFACKLGDPTQWFNYAGIASDSYAVSLGFADEVTAGCAYNNYIHFFTEDKIIKIYGDYSSNYQMYTARTDGVVSGGHDTVVQVEGILFYVSPIGVMAYDGSLPYFRGQKFAPNYLNGKTVVAGRDGTKYCLSVSENGKGDGVFVFDTKYGLWSVGGDQIYKKTAELDSALCFLNDQSHLVTLMDRNMDKDGVMVTGDNLFSLARENQDFNR